MTLHTWKCRCMPMYNPSRTASHLVTLKLNLFAPFTLANARGGTLLTLRRRVGKRVGLFKYPLKESIGLARMAWKRQHEVCDVVQCLAKADLCGTA